MSTRCPTRILSQVNTLVENVAAVNDDITTLEASSSAQLETITELENAGGTTFDASDIVITGDNIGNTLVAGGSTAASIATGHLVYLDSTEWKLASAGNGANAGSDLLIGIAKSASPHVDGVLSHGVFQLNTSHIDASALTVGKQVFMSATSASSGSYTTSIPSGSGQTVRVLGHAMDSETIYFAPSPDYIEI
tara:strand:- start:244 stop:822 length:579 start_codon:yes stop_codon:yes gene_type:complete